MSDEKKTPGDENPQDKDPYNFFKFAGPENNDDDNKDKKDGKKRFPFWGVMLIILALLALADVLFLGKPDGLIDYSEFKNKIESGEIVSVEIGETYFIGYGPAEISDVSSSQKGITLFNSSMQKNRTVYRTVGILMSNFIELLDEKGVDYKFVAKSNNYLLQLLMNLIVPFGLLFLIYFILF